eukprot:6181946-Pleurochrysis_carterae.AAC.3
MQSASTGRSALRVNFVRSRASRRPPSPAEGRQQSEHTSSACTHPHSFRRNRARTHNQTQKQGQSKHTRTSSHRRTHARTQTAVRLVL